MSAPLRLVSALPSSTLRQTAIASYRAARLSSARETAHTAALRLNPLSMAGFLLLTFADVERALTTVEGSDDYAVRVRGYLRDVQALEARS